MAFGNGPKIVTSGLVVSLDAADRNSYAGSGTTWFDLSGNENNGSLINGPTYTSSYQGTIIYDGTDDAVSIPDWMANITGGFTIQSIAMPTEYSGIEPALWGIYNTGGTYCRWNSNTSILVYLNGKGSTNLVASINTTNNINKFWDFTLTYDSGSTTTRGYINGLQVYSNTTTNVALPLDTRVTAVGRYATAGNIYDFKGNYGIFKAYNRALSAAEVLQNYNATKSRFGL
jgi:hypothetical protein